MAVSNTVSGFAVRYNEPTTIGQAFIERIAPGAFKDLSDVVFLWGHDGNRPLARTKSGTLQLRDEGRMGLWFSADLDPENPDAALALSSIGRQDTHGMSFGFLVRKEVWAEPDSYDALPERTILEADLFEVSAVVWPAYSQSDVSRSRAEHNASAAAAAIRRKAEAAHRLRGIR
ncbi:HK97 family phage prohead protease [Mesorhizobium sp.]|uniref:HK97 family phage prohead protease n=1 Tax=Mesorhizobium sp. TaxID=1871066 RepID=UPI0011FFA4CC|nr:HK97 family phage prohead protease [Mesorhizobium sp.]TIO04098.1 MAG: HK97 family phage prohead protease [Mesorhizobium sp.]TIO29339.1 MAG: HK97 family phage prohead protease [Mesorhizobium sp.]